MTLHRRPCFDDGMELRLDHVAVADLTGAFERVGFPAVVLGVPELAPAVRRFREVYPWCEPTYEDQPEWGARLAWFPDAPVVLATAVANGSWLGARTQRWGVSPCAYLVELGASEAIRSVSLWAGRKVAWLDLGTSRETRPGLTLPAQS